MENFKNTGNTIIFSYNFNPTWDQNKNKRK